MSDSSVDVTHVLKLITNTISQGAPAYNRGDIEGCCSLYTQAASELLTEPQLPTSCREALNGALCETGSSDMRAWALRRALDACAASLAGPSPSRGVSYTDRAKQVRILAKALRLGNRSELEWYVLNDGVMGGHSSSKLTADDAGGIVFAGNISLDGGGFASCRTLIEGNETLGLGGAAALRLRVSGDGQQYKVGLRATDGFREPSWQAEFDTVAGQVTEAVLPFDGDTWFGSIMGRKVELPPGRAIDWKSLRGVGLSLSLVDVHGRPSAPAKFHDGPFSLRVHSLSIEP